MIAANVVHASRRYGVTKLINLGSSCIYPRLAPQPIKEEHLLTGPLEPTNEPYAVAKIAAIKLCSAYNCPVRNQLPLGDAANLYGPNDNFDLQSSHVLPAMIRKMHEARVSGVPVTLWGDGSPRRELLHVDDLADALVFLMESRDAADIGELVNIGTGTDLTIRDLAAEVARAVGYSGRAALGHDQSRTERRASCSTSPAWRGWAGGQRRSLDEGLRSTYAWYLEQAQAS